MRQTVADQIREFLAPNQPDDSLHANLARLSHALKVTGPVLHHAMIVSSAASNEEVGVDFDMTRAAKEFARHSATPDGFLQIDATTIPPDADLAAKWGLPLAAETPLPPPDALVPTAVKTPDSTPTPGMK